MTDVCVYLLSSCCALEHYTDCVSNIWCRKHLFTRAQVLLFKRKTWTFWKNLRDGALNFIADMHAKRRQLMWHHKARVLQNSYRAHLTRVRTRGLSALTAASAHAAKPNSLEQPKAGSTFQQKRLPSKAMEIRNKHNVRSGAAAADIASSLSSPTASAHRDSDDATPPSIILPPAPETAPSASRARRMSM